jgi:hypothetical protein
LAPRKSAMYPRKWAHNPLATIQKRKTRCLTLAAGVTTCLFLLAKAGMPRNNLMCRKYNWIGHILRRNCLLKEVIEGKIKGRIEVTRRRGRRSKQFLDDLGDRRGYSHLKEEALDRIKWRNRFGRGCGPVV